MTERIPAELFPVGGYIVEEMKERSWTIKHLAELAGIDRTHLQQIIAGKTRLDAKTAEALGRTLGTSAEVWVNLDWVYRKGQGRSDG